MAAEAAVAETIIAAYSRSPNGNHNAHYINIILIKIKISVCVCVCCRLPSLFAPLSQLWLHHFPTKRQFSSIDRHTVVRCFSNTALSSSVRRCAISTVWRVAPVIRQPVIIYYLKLNFPWQCDASVSRASKHQQWCGAEKK